MLDFLFRHRRRRRFAILAEADALERQHGLPAAIAEAHSRLHAANTDPTANGFTGELIAELRRRRGAGAPPA